MRRGAKVFEALAVLFGTFAAVAAGGTSDPVGVAIVAGCALAAVQCWLLAVTPVRARRPRSERFTRSHWD